MAEAYYEPTPATDGATMNPVPGAVFQVFEIADTTFATPLSLRVGSGNPTTTVTASDTLATLPGVYVTSPNYEHIWKSGTFEWRRDSIDGAKKAIEDAKIAASNSANSAASSADSAAASASLVDAPADTVMRDIAANPASAFATQLSATYARGVDLDVRNYGTFAEGAASSVNAATMQAANDAAKALPLGATVHLPAGKYQVKGVVQDSQVTFRGHGTVLEHPDGLSSDIITSRILSTTGSITTDSHDVTVSSTANIKIGAMVAVLAAGGYSATQNTVLTTAVDATQTSGFTLTNATGFPTSGYMVIGTEVIQYTGISTDTLTGVTRGVLGTTAASHPTTDVIGMAAHHIAAVVGISGTTVSLDRPAALGVTGATVFFGAFRPGMYGIRFEGNRDEVTPHSIYPVRWQLVGGGHGDDIYSYRCESAFFLGLGTSNCDLGTITSDDCSNPEQGSGAAFWMFQSCRDNRVQHVRIITNLWSGVYLDDRTTIANPYDGPCDDNHIERVTIDVPVKVALNLLPTTTGVLFVASNRNTVGTISARGVRTPLVIEASAQWYTWDNVEPKCLGNTVAIFRAEEVYQPWVIKSTGNAVIDARYNSFLATGTTTGNPLLAFVSANGGGVGLTKYPDGTQAEPSIAFASEPGTGLYKVATGMIQFVSEGTLTARIYKTGLRLESGINLDFPGTAGSKIGTGSTQKLAFWGAAPVVQPAANPDTTGATLAGLEAEVNELKALLRTVGLMAP